MRLIRKLELKDKNILITGGTGLVGSHLIERLVELGSNLIVIYWEKNPKSYFFQKNLQKSVTLIDCDVKNKDRLLEIFSHYEPEIVFHLAAQTLVTTAYKNPLDTLHTNILGTTNILENSRYINTPKAILIASSDKAYGISEKLPYYETQRVEGRFPYEVSKSCADLISRMYFYTYNSPVIVTRMANIFGPGDLNFNRIIPGVMAAIIKNEVLNIRSNGKMVREYIYVEDVISALIALVENIEKTKGEAFNIGSNFNSNVIDLIDKISSILKQEIQTKILNLVKYEIPSQILSSEKINKLINWKPIYSFEKAIIETYNWYKDDYF